MPEIEEPLVTLLESRRAHLENVSSALRETLNTNGFAVGVGGFTSKADSRVIHLTGEEQMIALATLLAAHGAVFVGGASGWPPAAVLLELKEHGRFPFAFVEIVWRGPGDPYRISH